MSPLSLDELARQFVSCTLPRSEWTHHAHLRVGAWHVHRYGADEALERLRSGIRKLNDHHGTVNSSTSGYHETITIAYVRLIQMFLDAQDGASPLEHHVAVLLAGSFAERDLLLAFWSRDVLQSPQARAAWVPPDRAPLALPATREALPTERAP